METITIPRIVLRTFIQEHPNWIFLYGADYFRKGCLGQMWQCHGEPNAFPLSTCYKLCPSSDIKSWQDHWEMGWETLHKEMDYILYLIKDNPVIPLRKIGEGYSKMNIMAPRMYKFMKEFIERVKYPNIKIDYYAN